MYTSDFILQLALEAGKKIKMSDIKPYPSVYEAGFNDDKYYKSLPDFGKVYKESVKQHNKVAVHATIDVFPYELLKSKHPNQSQAEWDYQMGLYESITNSTWDRAKSKTKIISNSQNYSINWPDEEQKKYFYENYPTYHNIESYFFDIVRDRKIDFPNQVLLIKPQYIPGEFSEQEGEIIFKANQTVEVEPIVTIIDEASVVKYLDGKYLFIVSDEHSEYISNGKKYDDGIVFEFYDKEKIWHIRQDGLDNNFMPTFAIYDMYTHNWGWLPARKLGGKPFICNNEVLFHSIFIDAVPTLNTVIRLWSNMIMSFYSHAYPRMMVLVDDCQYTNKWGEKCQGGEIYDQDKKANIKCPRCKGSGDNIEDSPTGIYKVRYRKDDKQAPLTPPIQFAEPSSAILKENRDYIEQLKQDAFSFIYKSEQAKSDTATGDALQEQDFQSMLIHFSNELWDLMEFSIEAMGWYRWGEKFQKPEMSRPVVFDFRTPDDITAEIGSARENKLPQPYIQALTTQGIKNRLNNNDYAIYSWELQQEIDRLWNMDELEVQAGTGRTNLPYEAILHSSFTSIMKNIISVDFKGDYLKFKESSIEEKKKLFTDKAIEIANKIRPTGSEDANVL